MNRHAEYRLKALACAEAAERAHDQRERLELLSMAHAWIKLAEHAGTRSAPPTPRRPARPPDDAAAEADG